ncbi:hypothetical protein EVAR_21003_1 [Eumeta japonica]|uniref:Uncharacterized protein n=1 Tax=Eumeta variegata TaxID=151549 RepID=A0A4C1V6J2_EUMVA|nr:hypothetical protein EVAR_21003_1 [Eumeta japonica]
MAVGRYCLGVLLLTALVAAQLYDEAPSNEYRFPYQQKNELWRSEEQLQRSREDEDPPIILLRLLASPEGDDKSEFFLRLSNRQQDFDAEDKFLLVPPKRDVDLGGDFTSPATKTLYLRPQRKWQSKKGKKGEY